MTVNVTVTFPETVLERIDRERGDVKRSTYITKFLQHTWEAKLSGNSVTCGDRIQSENKDRLKKLRQVSHKVPAQKDSLAIADIKTTYRSKDEECSDP